MDIFTKIKKALDEGREEIEKEDAKYNTEDASSFSEKTIFNKETEEATNTLLAEGILEAGFLKKDFNEKRKEIEAVSRKHHIAVENYKNHHKDSIHNEVNIQKLASNSSDLLKEITKMNLYYFDMNEIERSKMEENIIFILNNTNELTSGELSHLSSGLYSYVAPSEIAEITEEVPKAKKKNETNLHPTPFSNQI